MANGILGPLFKQVDKTVAYFKKSTKAAKALHDQQIEHMKTENYWQTRIDELGWNREESTVHIPVPQKPLKPVLAMKVRWWSGIDRDTRFVLINEPWMQAIALVRADLKKRSKKEKAALLKFADRDILALTKLVPILYPFKSAIKELEGI